YDRGGNLIQTVPPKGVKRFEYDGAGLPVAPGADDILGSGNAYIYAFRANPSEADTWELEHPTVTNAYVAPAHTMATRYRYNSLNQLVYQVTPDGGESRFAYDKLGRLVLSQNDVQKDNDRYSYTRYDALGRVEEVGELYK